MRPSPLKVQMLASAACTEASCISSVGVQGENRTLESAEGDHLIALIAVFEEAFSLLENDTVAAAKWTSSRCKIWG